MKLNMNKDELRKFLLHAPQDRIMKYIEGIHPVDILDVLRENEEDRKDILNRLSELGEIKTVSLTANLMTNYHMSDMFISYLISRLIESNKIKIIEEGKSLWHSVITIIKD